MINIPLTLRQLALEYLGDHLEGHEQKDFSDLFNVVGDFKEPHIDYWLGPHTYSPHL